MPSVRKSYDEELLQLDTLLARMGHEAGAAIESALTALRNDDIELARSVVARDSQIDAGEHEIEHRCLQLLLRQQPVASDLRKVSTALKMVTDVERIGDQASDIAELVLHLHAKSTDAVGVLEDILKMGDDVLKMVKRSIAAYVQGWLGDADVRYSKDLNIKDDKSYIMSLLAVLTSGDSAAGHQIKELGGSFHENGYSIPQMQIRRKEKKNGF